MIGELEIVGRLLLALLLGGLIGLERETLGRSAGLRTHILVSVGSALIMLISAYGFPSGDPARLAAQVVSGIGFLGAGTIMREGATVRGLTTAASLWVVAGIGLAAGAGFYFGAALATLMVYFSLKALNKVEHRFLHSKTSVITVRILDAPGRLGEIGTRLGEFGVDIRAVEITPDDELTSTLEIEVMMGTQVDHMELIEGLRSLSGVLHAGYKGRQS